MMTNDAPFDLATKAGIDAWIQQTILPGARQNFEEHGIVEPFAIVLATQLPINHKVERVPAIPVFVSPAKVPPRSDDRHSKTQFADEVRRLARKAKAVGVALIMEAWLLDQPDDPVERERLNRRGISEHPDRKEAVIVTIDHLAMPSTRDWVAFIERDADGRGTLLEFKEANEQATARSGRFSHIFPRELWS